MSDFIYDSTKNVVKQFVSDKRFFTALDVSKEVKKTHPNAKHKYVRDVVRELFVGSYDTQEYVFTGYDRRSITVVLVDGKTAKSYLYFSDVYALQDNATLENLYLNQDADLTDETVSDKEDCGACATCAAAGECKKDVQHEVKSKIDSRDDHFFEEDCCGACHEYDGSTEQCKSFESYVEYNPWGSAPELPKPPSNLELVLDVAKSLLQTAYESIMSKFSRK